MEKANKKCAKIKQVYENCFRQWYTEEFMKGNVMPGCQDEFDEYKDCVIAVMQNKHVDVGEIPEASNLSATDAASSPSSSSSS
ncbi:TP53-regulated inhibitor of apoptosis 1 [Hondaea fermentalgiana]|uniref:TP53-regulated inhibitor of apoptosis 1 n=1 Tax=Hondaea fermentalgiana TaxID=2315210 RepID=A0A2R5G671_9STRA|nr:TP53-regulated inhibitor of apoptosis 1 [Hondaea fermentalgiana]|eukprot:GBG26536.1 TP53-regulated inhibitor of apoptosis 1 [Hondaea fermentalgiana]